VPCVAFPNFPPGSSRLRQSVNYNTWI